MKIRIFYLRFLYSQDLSNYKTTHIDIHLFHTFLYSQDLSNYKTAQSTIEYNVMFLYSQDLSNYKTTSLFNSC